jgi:hypothetical protein
MSALLKFPNANPADSRVAELVFDFVQFLLDDDTNLTPAGNLTAAARQKFRARLDELIAADESVSPGMVEVPSETGEAS